MSVDKFVPCPFCGAQPTSRFVGDEDGGYWAVECQLRLKAALAPFAKARDHFDGHVRDDDIVPVALRHIRAHHVIAAARSLDGEEGA
jgi:hypothetical protein